MFRLVHPLPGGNATVPPARRHRRRRSLRPPCPALRDPSKRLLLGQLGLFGLDLKPEPKKSVPAPQNRLGGGGDDDRFPDCARHCTVGSVSRTRWLLVNVVGGGIVAAVVGNPLLWIAWTIGVVAHVSYVVAMGRERGAVEAEQRAARLAAEQRHEEKDARRPLQASPVVVSERVVERQVVVTRCRYCKELTPVDLVECKSCGARL